MNKAATQATNSFTAESERAGQFLQEEEKGAHQVAESYANAVKEKERLLRTKEESNLQLINIHPRAGARG